MGTLKFVNHISLQISRLGGGRNKAVCRMKSTCVYAGMKYLGRRETIGMRAALIIRGRLLYTIILTFLHLTSYIKVFAISRNTSNPQPY